METVTCSGYRTAGVSAGLKKNGSKDLGLIFCRVPASVAGVFTRNRVPAAPVRLSRRRIKSGRCQAIIVNSGNANCCNGEQGMRAAEKMTELAAGALGISPELVMAASTGVIGEPLDIRKIEAALPALTGALQEGSFSDIAEAIMTTDTVPKTVSAVGRIDGKRFTVSAVAKGAGMIRPDMATMLCFACTDIDMPADRLQTALAAAVEQSFNRITIDGDTSTNDTVLLLANGLSGVTAETDAHRKIFQDVLDDVLLQLAKMLVRNGEGATKLVEVIVTGAASDQDARQVADTIAHSSLVKTALFGEDANWGRIIAAAGRAGIEMDPEGVDIFFDDVRMVKGGCGCGKSVEAAATQVLKKNEFAITIDLNTGSGRASVLTCDFSIDYVKINADYRS